MYIRSKINLVKVILLSSIALVSSLCVMTIMDSKDAEAVTASDWKAGNIIDDSIFYNNKSMSSTQIQNWISSRLSCDTNGSSNSEYSGGQDYNNDGRISRAEWARKVYGYTGKFVCLSDYYENPSTHASNLRTGVRPSGSISAAQIIKHAADTYDISPKVLIVKIRKESPGPLTSDEWPLPSQFEAALGYGCPDPPAGQPVVCDSSYKGFYRQVANAAKGLRNYKTYSSSYRYKPFKNNSIQYNPNTSCGSSTVYIVNYATAGLYNYTPYQPNKAALANMSGEGNSCSAYGNRNFWAMFNSMFGPTRSGNSGGYAASRIKGVGTSSTTMESGSSKTVTVKYKNTGSRAWYDIDSYSDVGDRPTVLQAVHPNGVSASGFNSSFASSTRATQRFYKVFDADNVEKTTNSKIVLPGEIVELSFTLSAPASLPPGQYAFLYRPLAPVENSDPRVNYASFSTFYITLTEPEQQINNDGEPQANEGPATSDYKRVDTPYRAARVRGPGMSSATLPIDSTVASSVYFKNTGTATWYDIESSVSADERPLILMFKHVNNTSTSAFNAAFPGPTRATQRISKVYSSTGEVVPTTTSTRKVRPGEVAKFTFTLTSPPSLLAGGYRAAYSPVIPANGTDNRIGLGGSETLYIDVTSS